MRARTIVLLGVVAATVLPDATADAGVKVPWPVTIDAVHGIAYGAMGDARSAPGGGYIGCGTAVTGTDTGPPTNVTYYAGCWAQMPIGAPVSCLFPALQAQTVMVPAMLVASRDSLVAFTWVSSNGNNVCTQIETWVAASVQPKVH